MSDLGSEPRPPGPPPPPPGAPPTTFDAPPPPAPPDLAPPPGYAGYSQNLSASIELKRVGSLRTVLVILLGIYIVGAIIGAIAAPGIVDSADDLLNGRISDDDFRNDFAVYGLMGGLSGVAQLAVVVLTIIWTYRIVKNHRSIGRRTRWGPGMAIGGWFLPPFLYIIPTLVLREAWKASDPAVPPGDDRWRANPDNPLIWVWFAVYGVGTLVLSSISTSLQIRQFGGEPEDIADAYADSLGVLIAITVAGIVSAVLWALIVRQLTDRHTRLTGEARA